MQDMAATGMDSKIVASSTASCACPLGGMTWR